MKDKEEFKRRKEELLSKFTTPPSHHNKELRDLLGCKRCRLYPPNVDKYLKLLEEHKVGDVERDVVSEYKCKKLDIIICLLYKEVSTK